MRYFVFAAALLVPGCPSADPQPAVKAPSSAEPAAPSAWTPIDVVLSVLADDDAAFVAALAALELEWRPGYAVMLLETMSFVGRRRALGIIDLLERKTGQRLGIEVNDWYTWFWRAEPVLHPDYLRFKARLYEQIDPRFAAYFKGQTLIRIEEIRWGGVLRDGIPPLENPKLLKAGEAGYLAPDNVVFGIVHHGDARAYPKRILAWHEMVKDTIGGEALCGVYCTLCGSMIFYRTEFRGVHHELGTSGFLYRSNKLMYDHRTESLWSTLSATPVVGPLVGQGIKLEPLSVVTTTWQEWRRLHPDTQVLSLDTGHERDYGEGVAYRDYFATDDLMFNVPERDGRLANKAEILAIRSEDAARPLAIALDYLKKHPIYHGKLARRDFVVLTDKTGANRVYDASNVRFTSLEGDNVRDEHGELWRIAEEQLSLGDRRLPRLAAHRAFWFGWRAAFPETELVY